MTVNEPVAAETVGGTGTGLLMSKKPPSEKLTVVVIGAADAGSAAKVATTVAAKSDIARIVVPLIPPVLCKQTMC